MVEKARSLSHRLESLECAWLPPVPESDAEPFVERSYDWLSGIDPDNEDDLDLGAAVVANADFLVTSDKGLLAVGEYHGGKIVTAEAFLAGLENQ